MLEIPTLTVNSVSHAKYNAMCNSHQSQSGSHLNGVTHFTTQTVGNTSNWNLPNDYYTISPYPYSSDGTSVFPNTNIPFVIEPFILPQPTLIFPAPPLDVDILVLPKEKVAKRTALRKELENLDDPIADPPKRSLRRIVVGEGE